MWPWRRSASALPWRLVLPDLVGASPTDDDVFPGGSPPPRSQSHPRIMGAKGSKEALPELSATLNEKLTTMFQRMDKDSSGNVDRTEAIAFWGKNFAKVNANAMFNEVDVDKNGEVTLAEWLEFWQNVLKHKYTPEEIEEEVDSMLEGGSWVDWNDGRST